MTFIIVAKSIAGIIISESRADDEPEAILKTQKSVNDGYLDAFYAPVPAGSSEYWIADPVLKTVIYDQQTADSDTVQLALDLCFDFIRLARKARLIQGIIWKFNNSGDPKSISINEDVQKLFSYTTTLRGKGRTNSHGGKFRQGNTKFNINDPGLEELSIFAAEWGLAIQRLAFDEIDVIQAYVDTHTDAENSVYLLAYDAGAIDWTIDWSTDPQNDGMGWDNDIVMQNP